MRRACKAKDVTRLRQPFAHGLVEQAISLAMAETGQGRSLLGVNPGMR